MGFQQFSEPSGTALCSPYPRCCSTLCSAAFQSQASVPRRKRLQCADHLLPQFFSFQIRHCSISVIFFSPCHDSLSVSSDYKSCLFQSRTLYAPIFMADLFLPSFRRFRSHPELLRRKQRCRQIPVAGIRQKHDNRLARIFLSFRQNRRSLQSGTEEFRTKRSSVTANFLPSL